MIRHACHINSSFRRRDFLHGVRLSPSGALLSFTQWSRQVDLIGSDSNLRLQDALHSTASYWFLLLPMLWKAMHSRRTTNGRTRILFSILNSHSYSILVQVVWLNVPLTLAELVKLTMRECPVSRFLICQRVTLGMPLKCQGLRTCTKQFRGIGALSMCLLSCGEKEHQK